MISARRAALLGLTTPLTAIMVAVLGLWPEDDEEPPLPEYKAPILGGFKRRISWEDLDDDEPEETQDRNWMIAAMTAAALVEIYG